MISMNVFLALGLLAAAFGSIAFLVYIRAIIWGTVRPCRSTWLIWTALSSLSLASNISAGASTSVVFLGTQTGFTVIICLLSLRYGYGKVLTKGDAVMLGVAGLGLLAWWWSHSPVWALALSLGVSAVGGVATTLKSYRAPQSESMTCWAMSLLGAILGLVSVGKWEPILMAYPLYLTLLYGAILTALLLGRNKAEALAPAHVTEPLVLDDNFRAARLPYRRHLRRSGQPSSPGLYQSP